MQSASHKASQRAVLTMLLSLGVGFIAAAITGEGAAIFLYILLGMAIFGVAISGLYRRPLRSLDRACGGTLARVFAIIFPLAGFLIFILYPIAVAFATAAGVDVQTKFAVVAAILFLLSLANLVVLVVNIVELIRVRQEQA